MAGARPCNDWCCEKPECTRCRADFTFTAASIQDPGNRTFYFTDETTTEPDDPLVCPIVEWLWDFGDGNFSSEQNPVHTYDICGVPWVTLLVTLADGKQCSRGKEVQCFVECSRCFRGEGADIEFGQIPTAVRVSLSGLYLIDCRDEGGQSSSPLVHTPLNSEFILDLCYDSLDSGACHYSYFSPIVDLERLRWLGSDCGEYRDAIQYSYAMVVKLGVNNYSTQGDTFAFWLDGWRSGYGPAPMCSTNQPPPEMWPLCFYLPATFEATSLGTAIAATCPPDGSSSNYLSSGFGLLDPSSVPFVTIDSI